MTMKCRIIGCLATFSLLFYFDLQAQSAVSDSLIKYVSHNKVPDSTKIKIYGDISWELMASDIRSSLQYAKKELELSQKLGRSADEAQSESDIGNVYNRMGLYDSALFHYYRGLDLRRKLGHADKMAGIYTNIATVLMRQNNYSEALSINFKTLKIFEESGDIVKQANVMGNIGNIYNELDQDESALKFLRKALLLAEEGKAPVPLGNILLNIGGIKFERNELDSALYYFGESERIMKENNLLYNLAAVYNNQGKIYSEKKEYSKAISYYEKALKNRQELSDNLGIGLSNMNLGEAYMQQGDLNKSLQYLHDAELILKDLEAYVYLKQVYAYIASVHEMNGDYRQANIFYKLYATYKDSVFTQKNAEKMAELQTKFESEKKDLEIAKQNAEITLTKAEVQRKNIINYVLIASVAFILVISWLLWNRRSLKQRALLDAQMLHQQEIRGKAVIEAEERERMRIARDLHDGIGQTLSAARINLSGLESRLDIKDPEIKELLKNSLDLVDDSVKEVRSVSHNMMPNSLFKAGLAAAVREFINKLSAIDNLKIELEVSGLNERLEPSTETVLFRVLQEVVSNIIRHAGASRISIQLIKHENEITLMVEDNGRGFDVALAAAASGIGLRNIYSRVEYLNGSVHFDSQPKKGTTVTIEVPYKPVTA
jgi:signal transduction histidine kinase